MDDEIFAAAAMRAAETRPRHSVIAVASTYSTVSLASYLANRFYYLSYFVCNSQIDNTPLHESATAGRRRVVSPSTPSNCYLASISLTVVLGKKTSPPSSKQEPA